MRSMYIDCLLSVHPPAKQADGGTMEFLWEVFGSKQTSEARDPRPEPSDLSLATTIRLPVPKIAWGWPKDEVRLCLNLCTWMPGVVRPITKKLLSMLSLWLPEPP